MEDLYVICHNVDNGMYKVTERKLHIHVLLWVALSLALFNRAIHST